MSAPVSLATYRADIDSTGPLSHRLRAKSKQYHERIPLLCRLPFPAIAIVSLLIAVNIAVWIAVGIVLVRIISFLIVQISAY